MCLYINSGTSLAIHPLRFAVRTTLAITQSVSYGSASHRTRLRHAAPPLLNNERCLGPQYPSVIRKAAAHRAPGARRVRSAAPSHCNGTCSSTPSCGFRRHGTLLLIHVHVAYVMDKYVRIKFAQLVSTFIMLY